jgi:phosphopantetheinyl transferase
MLQNPALESAVELPRQLVHAPLIHRIIELYPSDKRLSAPKARFIFARNRGANSSHQSRRTACRYLLQQLLSVTSTVKQNEWKLYHSASGAPCLSINGKPPQLDVSMTHSADWLAAGVAFQARIGVDVERFRPRGNISAMADFLGWKGRVRDNRDFYSKWVLWEASAKCVEGSVLMRENPGFERLCNVDTRDQVTNSGHWSGLHGCLEEKLFYAIVLECPHNAALTHRILDAGNIEPW